MRQSVKSIQYKMKYPFGISSRLRPSVKIGKTTISLIPSVRDREGRVVYDVMMDFPLVDGKQKRPYRIKGVRSGVGATKNLVKDGMETVLCFLIAAGDAYRSRMQGRESDNDDIFPTHIMEWAYQNYDELTITSCEVQDTEDCVTEHVTE